MRSPRILLIGIGGVYNYGCEAIVRGTEKILHREYPNAQIVYASRRPSDDQRRLAGSEVRIIERKRNNRYSVKNICRKMLSLGGIRWDIASDSLALLKNVDAVISIGGDIYTLNASGGYSLSFAKFGDAVRRRGIPYVLWGASVGPFTQNPKAEKAFSKHLKGLSLITARENATIEYLRSIGVRENVVPCADPAYVVGSEITANGTTRKDKFTIGVNLSPLSIRHTGDVEEEAIPAQAKTIEGLVKTFDAHIILIPHVVSNFNEKDDDFRYLYKISQTIAPEYQDSVTLIENDPGFVGIKKVLVKCNLVIAARMHCAINALSAQVPTILAAYSSKASGMCNYVYGNTDLVIPLKMFAKEGILAEKILFVKKQNSHLKCLLTRRIPEIQTDALSPLIRMNELISL